MNVLVTLFSEPWVQRLGWVLIHFLWQGTVIALLLAVVLRLLTRASSHVRYAMIGGALLFCGVMPVATWTILGPQAQLSVLPASNFEDVPKVETPAALGPNSYPDTIIVSPQGHPETPWQDSLRRVADKGLPYVVSLWFGGVLILTLRLTLGWTLMRRLLLSSLPIEDARCQERFRGLWERMQVRVPVRLLQSALVEVPTLIGWLRPTILVPSSVFIGLSPDQLEAILAHELAHVRRYDYLVNLFQTVIETILFYHPAVWWISRKLREERENCCDDIALEVMQDRLVYASALAQLEAGRGMPLVLTASGGSLLQRIKRIVGANDRKVSAWPLWILIIGILSIVSLIRTRAMEAPDTTKSSAQTYLEVSYVETADTSAMPGGMTTTSGAVRSLVQNPKNKHSILNDFPLKLGMNTLHGQMPWGADFTVTLNWSNSVPNNAQGLGLKMEWLHANGGDISYGSEFKASLRPDECFVVTGPWKTKETSNLLISFVDHPSERPQKGDAATGDSDAKVDFEIAGQSIPTSKATQESILHLLHEHLVMRYVNGTPDDIFHWQRLPDSSVEQIKTNGSFLHIVYLKKPPIPVGATYSYQPDEVWIGLQDGSTGESYPGYPAGIMVVTSGKDGTFNLMFGSKSLLTGMGLIPEIFPHLPSAMQKSLEANRGTYQHYLDWTSTKDASGQSVNQQVITAVQKGDVATLQKLILQGVDITKVKGRDPTLLFEAASPEVAELLIQHGADVHVVDAWGSTALDSVVRNSPPNIAATARVLLEHGADPNRPSGELRMTPAMEAYRGDTLDALVEHGADLKATDRDGYDVVFCAGRHDVTYLQSLIRHGVAFDPRKDGPTIMVQAAWVNNLSVIKWLLDYGVDPNAQGLWVHNKNGKDDMMFPLEAVAISGQFDAAKLLLDHSARWNKATALALQNHYNNIVKLLWEHGVRDISGLSYAISQNAKLEDLEKILQSGTPVDSPNDTIITPLGEAAETDNLSAVQLLVQHGADVNKGGNPVAEHSEYRDTPLVLAAERGQDEIVAFLLQHGAQANPNAVSGAANAGIPNSFYVGKDHLPSKEHYERAIQMLTDAGALKDITPEWSGRILVQAMSPCWGDPDPTILQKLLAAGLSPEVPMPYLKERGEKPNSVIGYYRDTYQKYKDDPSRSQQTAALKPLLDMLEAANKEAAPKSDADVAPKADASTNTLDAAQSAADKRDDQLYNDLRIENLKVQDMPLDQFIQKISKELAAQDPQKQGINFILRIPPGEPPIRVSLDFTKYLGYRANIAMILGPLKARYPIRYKLHDSLPGIIYITQLSKDEIAFDKKASSTLIDIDFSNADPVMALKSVQAASASKGFTFDLDLKSMSQLDAWKKLPAIDLKAAQISVDQALRSIFYLADFHPVPLEHFTGYTIQPQSPEATKALTYLDVGIQPESFTLGTVAENWIHESLQRVSPWTGPSINGPAYNLNGAQRGPGTMTQKVPPPNGDLEQNFTVDPKIIDKVHIQVATSLEIKDSHGNSLGKVSGNATLVSGERAMLTSSGSAAISLPGKGIDPGLGFVGIMQITLVNQEDEPLLPPPTPPGEEIPVSLISPAPNTTPKVNADATVSPSPAATDASQPPQTYLEVSYIETTDTSAMPGGLTIEGDYAKKLIQNPKNEVTKLIDFPLMAETNTIKGKTPSGFDFTITLNWNDSSVNKAQDIAVKEGWLNANGGGVSYGAEFKGSLRRDQCFLITGPWKTKETSNLLIGFVDYPSGQPQKADSGTNATDPNAKTVQEKYASQLDSVPPDQKETAAKAFAVADAFLSAIDSGSNVPAPGIFDGTMPTDESWPAYLDGVRARFGEVQARHFGTVDSVSQADGIYELSVDYETTFRKGNATSTALELVRVARTPPTDPKGEWKVTEFNIYEKNPTGQWSSPVTILSPDADARAEAYFNQTLERERTMVADPTVKSSTLAADAQMLEAIQKGDVDSLKKVLEHAVDPNTFDPDRFDSSPVYWAVHFNQPEILKLLLEHFAKGESGPANETPLALAQKAHPNLVPILQDGIKRNRAILTDRLIAQLHSIHIDLPAFSGVPMQKVVTFLLNATAPAGYLERRVTVGTANAATSAIITAPSVPNISIWDALQTIADANKLRFDVDCVDIGNITFYPSADEAIIHPPTGKADATLYTGGTTITAGTLTIPPLTLDAQSAPVNADPSTSAPSTGKAVFLEGRVITTPLTKAISGGDYDQVKSLIDQGQAITDADMIDALEVGRPRMIKLLWDRGARYCSEMVYAVSQNEPVSELEKLRAAGVPVERPGDPLITPLGMAAKRGNMEAARWLLDHGADIKASQNPLNFALADESVEMVDFLLKKGAQIDPFALAWTTRGSGDFSTPALTEKRMEMIKLLIKAGALDQMQENEKALLLAVACDTKNPALLKLYLDAGVSPLSKNSDGNTALEIEEAYVKRISDSSRKALTPLLDMLEAAAKGAAPQPPAKADANKLRFDVDCVDIGNITFYPSADEAIIQPGTPRSIRLCSVSLGTVARIKSVRATRISYPR